MKSIKCLLVLVVPFFVVACNQTASPGLANTMFTQTYMQMLLENKQVAVIQFGRSKREVKVIEVGTWQIIVNYIPPLRWADGKYAIVDSSHEEWEGFRRLQVLNMEMATGFACFAIQHNPELAKEIGRQVLGKDVNSSYLLNEILAFKEGDTIDPRSTINDYIFFFLNDAKLLGISLKDFEELLKEK